MPLLRILPLVAALLIASACDRVAGTEVGNPEITVAARFGIHDTDAAASIPDMNLKVMGMSWTIGSYAGACWNEPGGYLVDLTGRSRDSLPSVRMTNGAWSRAEMLLQSPAGDSTLPDTSSFGSWSNPRYAKLVKIMGKDTVRVLFRMPEDMWIKLKFERATIDSWRGKERITVKVMLDAGKWMSGLGSVPAFAYRTDGEHARYIVLAPGENAAAYRIMKESLASSFLADDADML
jgi:hypothetical protein